MDVMMPDGTMIQDIPQGTSKEAVLEKYNKMYPEKEGTEETAPQMQGFKDYSIETASNVIPDAFNIAKGVGSMVMHPIDTAGAIADSMLAPNKNIPQDDLMYGVGGAGTERGIGNVPRNIYEMLANPLLDEGKTPQGISEAGSNISENFKDKPLSTMLEVLPAFGRVAKTGKALQKTNPIIGSIIEGVGKSPTAPIKAPLNLAKLAGEKIYESALSFDKGIGFKARKNAAQVGADMGLSPTIAGVEKLNKAVGSRAEELQSILTSAEKNGINVPIEKIIDGRNALLAEARYITEDPAGLRRKINKVFNNQIKEAKDSGRMYITPTEANKLKKGLNKKLNFNVLNPDFNTNTAIKQMSTNLKGALEEISPDVNRLNAEMSPLLNLRDALYGEAWKGSGLASNAISKANIGNRMLGPVGMASGLVGPMLKTLTGSGIVKSVKTAKKAGKKATLMEILSRESTEDKK